MEVKTDTEITEKTIFSTETHKFSINTEKLDALKESKNFNTKIGKRLTKGLRTIVDASNGDQWDNSLRAIYFEITGDQWSAN